MSDFNDQVMADFVATNGKPGGPMAGNPVLLLHAIGAKSGADRTVPLMYQRSGDGPWYIFASKGGAPQDPDWFHNVVAHSEFDISVGDGTTIERIPIRARTLEGEERDQVYARQAELYPQFADYAHKTTREFIPVVELTRR